MPPLSSIQGSSSSEQHRCWRGAAQPCPGGEEEVSVWALTTVAFVAVVPTVVLQVTFVGQRDAGPRALAAELGLGVAHGGG